MQELLVHCEQQVLRFVMSYLSSTEVEPHDAAAIWGEVSNYNAAAAAAATAAIWGEVSSYLEGRHRWLQPQCLPWCAKAQHLPEQQRGGSSVLSQMVHG
mgnify:CR=1 FL=1